MKCRGTNVQGEPCGAPERLVGADGLCEAHQEGGEDRMREMAAKGGLATARKHRGEGFSEEDLAEITSLEDAKLALDQIRVAVRVAELEQARQGRLRGVCRRGMGCEVTLRASRTGASGKWFSQRARVGVAGVKDFFVFGDKSRFSVSPSAR